MTIDEMAKEWAAQQQMLHVADARIAALEAENARLREDLRMIADDNACGHNGWSDYELLRKMARAALNHSDANKMVSPWQPIETAPKDGTAIIAWNEERLARETFWRFHSENTISYAEHKRGNPHYPDNGFWIWEEPSNNWCSAWYPTHWMPLPPRPANAGGKEGA